MNIEVRQRPTNSAVENSPVENSVVENMSINVAHHRRSKQDSTPLFNRSTGVQTGNSRSTAQRQKSDSLSTP